MARELKQSRVGAQPAGQHGVGEVGVVAADGDADQVGGRVQAAELGAADVTSGGARAGGEGEARGALLAPPTVPGTTARSAGSQLGGRKSRAGAGGVGVAEGDVVGVRAPRRRAVGPRRRDGGQADAEGERRRAVRRRSARGDLPVGTGVVPEAGAVIVRRGEVASSGGGTVTGLLLGRDTVRAYVAPVSDAHANTQRCRGPWGRWSGGPA